MSWPTTTVVAPTTWTNACPVARASCSSICSGTVPRTSYALKTARRLAGSRVSAMLRSLVGSVGGQHAQVPATAGLTTGLLSRGDAQRGHRAGGLADRVGQSQQIIGRGAPVHRVASEPEDLPAARRREAFAVRLAQVVGVRLGIGGQRAEDRRLVRVDVGQRRDRGSPAGRARTAAGRTHVAGGRSEPR